MLARFQTDRGVVPAQLLKSFARFPTGRRSVSLNADSYLANRNGGHWARRQGVGRASHASLPITPTVSLPFLILPSSANGPARGGGPRPERRHMSTISSQGVTDLSRREGVGDSEPPPAFPSPFVFNTRELVTLVELRMRRFSGSIRAKPDWWAKVNENGIVAKWRAEIVEQDRVLVDRLWGGEERYEYGEGEKQWPWDPITDPQLDYLFAELRHEARRRDPKTGIYETSIPKVYESQSLVPQGSKDALVGGVAVLEDVPEEEKDWHPGSSNQVLDLVHPSLYCLRVGESYTRTDSASSRHQVELLTEDNYMASRPDLVKDHEWAVSRKYQWLPTDLEVSDSGEVKALAYINNLHPTRHAALYPCIEGIVARFVPLFERVLSAALSPDPPLAINVNPERWYEGIPECDSEDDYEILDWERRYQWPTIPDPAPFRPHLPSAGERVEYSLRGRKIQVVVKLANIVLTPESPEYPGGAWHVEGMANERMVATGLYYYACANIAESRLAFRAVVGDEYAGADFPYQQDDHRGHVLAYGFGRSHALNQALGHVVAAEDKCVAFPNVYQHRVEPFALADPSRPGHRKILCLFLVNPEVEVLSTTAVPPQQAEWLADGVLEAGESAAACASLGARSQGTMSRKEAEAVRERLMQERAQFVMKHNEKVYEVEFSMCEH
ncbi:hypothetical protein C8Q80DRAFT_277017 [Daedaleopsis nitida]|nr:hypothetical protein C8Q80DRAFT_277017 [Daedaleopsis nitida]